MTNGLQNLTRLLVLLGAMLPAQEGAAKTGPECETHVRVAEREHGIPSGLLVAIARTESGRSRGKGAFGAWPWTLNVEGQGHYFKNRADARAKLVSVIGDGVRSVDVGCLQINYRWHGQEFTDIDAMLDPATNADYAARYLKSLRDQYGDWDTAVAYYHSRDPDRGTAYRERVARQKERLAKAPKPQDVASSQPVVETVKPRQSLPTDSRFQNRPALISLPQNPVLASNPALPEGKLPKPLSEVRSSIN